MGIFIRKKTKKKTEQANLNVNNTTNLNEKN